MMPIEKCLDEPLKKDETSEIPENWKLGEIGTLVKEFQSGFACARSNIVEDGIPHLRPNNIGYHGKLNFSHIVYLPNKMVNLQKYSLRAGDVLFNNTNSKELVGRASLVKEDFEGGFSNHITRLKIDKGLITSEWLVISINYLWSQGYFLKQCRKWIGQAGINTQMLRTVKIPIPPLGVQKRIVARIDQLTSKIDQAKRLKEETMKDTGAIMQAVLRQVFSYLAKTETQNARLGDVAIITMGQSPSGATYNEERRGMPLINGPTEFGPDHPEPVQWTTEPTHTCEAGDILICVRGATTGRMNWADQEYCLGRGVASLRPLPTMIPEFLYHFVQTQAKEILGRSSGSTFPNLRKRQLESLPVPVPSLTQQSKIAKSLNLAGDKVYRLKEAQEETRKKLDTITLTVLRMAFSGKL